jgi:hypothetical protein
MPVQSSFHTVAEQVITFNNNVVDLLSKINSLVTTTDSSITLNIADKSGVTKQFSLPSFGFLKSEIDRLNNNINSIYSINDAGALIQTSNNKFKKVVTVDLNREPNDVGALNTISVFKSQKNWFFDELLNPELFIELDLSGKIENNVRKCLSRRYIVSFAKDSSGNFTPLGQSALNSFNTLFRNKSNIRLDELERWYLTTPGVVDSSNPNIDEQIFDLDPNQLNFDGTFTVIKIQEDTLNKKLWYHVDTLQYLNTQTKEVVQLSIGSELIINTPLSTTRYKIVEISTSESNPRLRFERVEGVQPIPVGIGTLKIYSPVVYTKTVKVSVGYNERNVVFIKSLNTDNYILSKNWSLGLGYWTNDLRLSSSDSDNGVTMEQYYIDKVDDYGTVLQDLVAKKTPTKLAGVPNPPLLDPIHFKVLQINKHLTDTADSNLLKSKHNQQKTLKSEIQQLSDAIQDKNKQIKVTRFTSDSARKQFSNELDRLQKVKEGKSKLLTGIVNDILDLSNSPVSKAEPVFRVRGFWDIPEPIITSSTKPQEVVQFIINYRYLSKDGKESPVETFKLIDKNTTTSKTAAFSNWIAIKTDARVRVLDPQTGKYSWKASDVGDADMPNINQADIPIRSNEKVEIRVKSISEVGWPDSPIESAFSDILTIEFPTDLNNVLNENGIILKEATKEDLRVSIQSDLSAKGLDEHLSETLVINNKTFHHASDKILSGFKDENGTALDLHDYLKRLENRIISLEEKIKRVKGVLEIIIFKNSEQFVVKNNSNITFTIECEDYLENFTGPGVPTGRVYRNDIYNIKDFLIKVKNKSVESPLGLLSNRGYDTSIDVYNPNVPQVFWVDNKDELITSNFTGVSKTQIDNQFIWSVNYDNVSGGNVTKLSEDIGNKFNTHDVSNNSITNNLSSSEFNIGYDSNQILSFVGSNNTLTDPKKWIDTTPSVSSTTKLLSTIHPSVSSLDKIAETNSEKIRTVNGGEENDINIPLNIYFKMNALDQTKPQSNYQYINLNSSKQSVRHTKKLKFLLENESDNRPFIFTVTFIINRSKVIMNKVLSSTPTQLSR